jgi:hypothetical protein
MKNINNWYDGKMGNDHQGLIADEKTGKNIAVCYDKKHTALISACPEMYEALKRAAYIYESSGLMKTDEYTNLCAVLAKAEGRA